LSAGAVYDAARAAFFFTRLLLVEQRGPVVFSEEFPPDILFTVTADLSTSFLFLYDSPDFNPFFFVSDGAILGTA